MANKNSETKNDNNVEEMKTMIEQVFRYWSCRDYGALIYIMNRGYDLEDTEAIYRHISRPSSFGQIDCVAELYQYLKDGKIDKTQFATIVTESFGSTRSVESLEAFLEAFRSDMEVSQIISIATEFRRDEELIISAFKYFRYIKSTMERSAGLGHRHTLYDVILACRSSEAMKISITLFKRGAMIEEIISILHRFIGNGESQVKALKQENLKRRIAGTIRDDFMLF